MLEHCWKRHSKAKLNACLQTFSWGLVPFRTTHFNIPCYLSLDMLLSIEKDPECIVLHIGTNDLNSKKSEVDIAEDIVNLATSVKNKDIEVKISGLVPRGDVWEARRSKVNHVLHDLCNENEIELIEHLNIDPEKHLNNSKIHLNRHGDQILKIICSRDAESTVIDSKNR